ncbi:alkene reductase [Deinococcus sp. UYEF24]
MNIPPIVWEPVTLGQFQLKHRLVMAPMTRSRATPEGVPTALNAEYYAQRASMPLIITEGVQPSAAGQGYILTPGIYTDEQVAGWRLITDAVHRAGGQIVMQLMHAGRISHPDNTLTHQQPVAPSAVRASGQMFTASGMTEMPEPCALTTSEVAETVQDYRRAAANARRAGLDGVEIHAANGYLPHQFLSGQTNRRTDQYGGSVANRVRFVVELARSIADEIGAERTGIRISPGNGVNDLREDDIRDVYPALISELAPLGLAYLHIGQGRDEELLAQLRREWPGKLILSRGGIPLESRFKDLESGLADVVAVGVAALANPDLIERLQAGAPLNPPDQSTFYGGDERGYTDYPALTTATLVSQD